MNLKKSFVFLIFFSVLIACTYKKEVPPNTGSICNNIGTPVSFATKVKPILQTNCLSCHSNVGLSGGISLEGHNNVRSLALSGLLLGVIQHSPGFSQMPKGASKLTPCEIETINFWIQQGAQNN